MKATELDSYESDVERPATSGDTVHRTAASQIIVVGPNQGQSRSPRQQPATAGQNVARVDLVTAGSEAEEDEVTIVDGALATPSEAHDLELANRIRLALDETRRFATPPVPPAGALPPHGATPDLDMRAGRLHPFKQTMLFGLPAAGLVARPVTSVLPAGETAGVVSAAPVRPIGLPTSPPPRRSRRADAGARPRFEAPSDRPQEHEPFELNRRSPSPPPVDSGSPGPEASPEPAPAASGVPPMPANAQFWGVESSPVPTPEPGVGVMTPPPSIERVAPTGSRGRKAVSPPILTELPSVDPFEGFVAAKSASAIRLQLARPRAGEVGRASAEGARLLANFLSSEGAFQPLPRAVRGALPKMIEPHAQSFSPRVWRRWVVALVIALALVGAASLAALASGYLGARGG